MSSVFNKIANAVTGHSNTTDNTNPTDSGSNSGLPAGNQNSGVGSNYAGTNYSSTNNGALKEGSQVRDTGLHSGRTGDYSNTGLGSGSSSHSGSGLGSTAAGAGLGAAAGHHAGSGLGSTAAGAGLGAAAGHHLGRHHGTSSSLGSSTASSLGSSSLGSTSSYGSSTASSLGSSTASSMESSTSSGMYSNTTGPRSGYNDDAMTRSEEHLLVGKEKVNVGTAALNKYVTTEKVSTAIPIVREKAVVEREPITDANRDLAMRGPDFKESHYEVNLMEERAVAEKQTVPIERVRLRKEAEQTQQYVEADLRKEHIELVDPTKEGLGRNNASATGTGIGAGIGKDSSSLTGTGSSYSGSNLSSDRQMATDAPTSSASRQY